MIFQPFQNSSQSVFHNLNNLESALLGVTDATHRYWLKQAIFAEKQFLISLGHLQHDDGEVV